MDIKRPDFTSCSKRISVLSLFCFSHNVAKELKERLKKKFNMFPTQLNQMQLFWRSHDLNYQ